MPVAAKAPRPIVRYRPEHLRASVGRRALKRAPKANGEPSMAIWAWGEAKARGYDEAQWQALASPSAALRNVVAVLYPHRLPAPGSPWPDAVRQRFVDLMTPRAEAD